MRFLRLSLLLTAALLLSLALAATFAARAGYDGTDLRNAVIAAYSSALRQPRATADDAALRFTVSNPLGVNTFLEQEVDPAIRRRSLSMARDAGFHWVRQQFPWAGLEPDEKGRFVGQFGESTWDVYDDIVAAVDEFGMELIVRLDTSPKWARPGNSHVATPPERLVDFGDYVAAVVERYRGRVRYYQVWNEPNLSVEWGNGPVDAHAATALLRVGYERAKRADPDAVILAPALAPTIADGPEAVSELVFLQEMYDAGAVAYFDIGSVQAYGLRHGPDDRRLGPGDVNFSRPILYREVMVRNGDAAKPVWASEVAWNAPPPEAPGPYLWGKVSPEQQARYTVRALQRARDEWAWMGVMNIWYLRRPDEREMGTVFAGFRLLDPDFTPRPVYRAIQSYAGSLPHARQETRAR
jgi:broad specificity phosphatase PhoE